MAGLSALDTVKAVAQPIGSFGGSFMLHPDTLSQCKEFGYPNGFAYYVAGRGGVLGDVDADVVSAAFGPFAPSLVRTMWEAGVEVEGARASAARYAEACAAWGERRLQHFDGASRFVSLAERVIANTPTHGYSLFVGWRALPRPETDAARAYFLLHLLREWRGSAHVLAVAATGLTPLESILALDESEGGGPEKARRFGWQEPFANASHLRATRVDAENLTDTLLVPTYEAALNSEERGEFVALVSGLASHLQQVLAAEAS